MVGPKPGEKMYEELMNSEEVRRTKELENYFCIDPVYRCEPSEERGTSIYSVKSAYNSNNENFLSVEETQKLLTQYGLLGSLAVWGEKT